MSTKAQPLTEIPTNLENLDKGDIIQLLKRVAGERDDLKKQTKKAKTSSKQPLTVAAFAGASASAAVPKINVKTIKSRISKNMIRVVKKTAHNDKKKPWSEVTDSLPAVSGSDNPGYELMEGFTPVSDTARLTKWQLDGNDTRVWLGLDSAYVHPVKFDGRVFWFGSGKPNVYAWASFETTEIKYEKKTGGLTCKFRTLLAGTGKPNPGENCPPP